MIYDNYREQLDALNVQMQAIEYPESPTAPEDIKTVSYKEVQVYFAARDEYDALKRAAVEAVDAIHAQKQAIWTQMEREWITHYLGDEYAFLDAVISYPAYEKGHHSGHYEIELKYADLAEIAVKAVKAYKETL